MGRCGKGVVKVREVWEGVGRCGERVGRCGEGVLKMRSKYDEGIDTFVELSFRLCVEYDF